MSIARDDSRLLTALHEEPKEQLLMLRSFCHSISLAGLLGVLARPLILFVAISHYPTGCAPAAPKAWYSEEAVSIGIHSGSYVQPHLPNNSRSSPSK